MPDKKEIQKALDRLDEQVTALVADFVKKRRAHYEEAAQKLHTELKQDTQRYAVLLMNEQISKADFEFLLQGRATQLKIELLAELAVTKRKFEAIFTAILKLTVKTIFDLI